MKKLLAILLILSMIFSLSVAMTGCEDSSYSSRSSSRRDRDDDDDDDDDDRDDDDAAGQDDDTDTPVDDEPSDTTEAPTNSGETNEVVITAVPLAELPIVSDDTNLNKGSVQDAYGNEYEGPYFDLVSYGYSHRSGKYVTQDATEFNVSGQYRYFSGTFFTRSGQSEDFTVEFMVYADDVLIFRSEPISRKTKAIDFTIDIGNCDVLKITSISYDYTATNTHPGIILVNALVTNKFDGTLTKSAEINHNLIPLTDLHVYGTASGSGDCIVAGPVEDAYGNLYKGIYLDLHNYASNDNDEYVAYMDFVNNGEYRYLSGTFFARAEQPENYTIEFLIYADDELVYRSGYIDRSTKPIDFVVEIGDCDLIRVVSCTTDYSINKPFAGIILIDPFVSTQPPQ